MPFRQGFEAFVDATAQARSPERLCEILLAALEGMGFDRVNFTVQRDDDLDKRHTGFGIVSTYPSYWQDYYQDRELIKIDPVARCASSAFGPFRWRDIERKMPLSRRQTRFLLEAEEAGLHNGIGIPFYGPKMQIGGVAMASSTRLLARPPNLDLIAAYCNHFYIAYKRLVRERAPYLPPIASLSDREREIMIRLAHGRTNDQIAGLLGTGSDTVDYHLRNVFRKLDVNSRVAAVALCLQYGLIEL